MPTGNAHPEVLVDTVSLNDHLGNSSVRVVEVSEDVTLYGQGHISGAIHFNWQTHARGRNARHHRGRHHYRNATMRRKSVERRHGEVSLNADESLEPLGTVE